MPNTSSRTLKVRLDFLRVNRLIIRTTETTDRYRLCFKISIQMIVSFGVNVKPLALSPLSFFHWSNRMEEPTLLIEKSGGRFPGRGGGGGLPFTHYSYHGHGFPFSPAASSAASCISFVAISLRLEIKLKAVHVSTRDLKSSRSLPS